MDTNRKSWEPIVLLTLEGYNQGVVFSRNKPQITSYLLGFQQHPTTEIVYGYYITSHSLSAKKSQACEEQSSQRQQLGASLMASHLIRRTRTQAGCRAAGEHRLIKTPFINGTINTTRPPAAGCFH